jgi:uncharacterized protein YcbX
MTGRIAALWRHPIKGFTPEALDAAVLRTGRFFPGDRVYAVEDGPSGFDPAAPAHINKMKFAALVKIPELARARTLYDAETGELTVTAEGFPPFHGRLTAETGREAFARWLAEFLEEQAPEQSLGPLRVLEAPDGHGFVNSRNGLVSILNLDSVRDLEQAMGRPIDPLRFRANVWVEGWGAWREYGLGAGAAFRLGAARMKLRDDIVRCLATHVDPRSGARDMDVMAALQGRNGHIFCGIYAEVTEGGRIAVGDEATLPQAIVQATAT